MDPIKLLIVDDHPLFRQGLVDVLESDPGLVVVAQAADGEVAVHHAIEHQPDIVLMDVNLPNTNGLRVTRHILNQLPDTRVIILTGYDDAEQVFHACASVLRPTARRIFLPKGCSLRFTLFMRAVM